MNKPVELTAEEAFREAEARISAWKPGQPLDLAIEGLERIPSSIGQLSELNVLTLTQWDNDLKKIVGGLRISDLGQLSGLASLRSLDCSDTKVSNLRPLFGLTALCNLYCSRTKVSDLEPLSGLTSLQSLNCAGTKVSDLEPLSGLTSLQSLDCAGTKVSDLEPLSGLTSLQSLDCAGTKVSDLKPLSGLTSLQSLDCAGTKVSDLEPLSGLTSLQSLDCAGTKVSDLGPLSRLTSLKDLKCWNTQISDLGPLSRLTSLKDLKCWNTQISDLGPLSRLTALQSLKCWNTQISDLDPISDLIALRILDCSFCEIQKIPFFIQNLSALNDLILYKATIRSVPTEVLSQDYSENCLDRLRAHLRDSEKSVEPMREAKVLVLGNGRVGKTQLCNRLLGEDFEEQADSTHGILVRWYDLPGTKDEKPARLQLWDFGGQDIYHSTHILFMRSQGIYLIAWNPAQESNENHVSGDHEFRNYRLPYWLTQVAEFGGSNAPLIVVQTQVDRLIDRRKLDPVAEKKFAGFTTTFEIDCSAKTGRHQEDLKEALAECYARIEQPLIGGGRARVKRALEELIRTRRYMTLEEFRTLCNHEGNVTDPVLFLETLHNAGTVFYRPALFNDQIILDLEWAIRAIYAVFDRASQIYQIILSQNGLFTRTLLGQVLWDRHYSPEEQELFLAMMMSCGICFEKQQADSSHRLEATYIAPDLLQELPTDGGWQGDEADHRQKRYYSHLPGSLIRAVICAIGQDAGNQGDYWRHGVRINEVRRRSEGLIVSDFGTGRLTLYTRNGASAELLAILIEIIEREEDRLGLKPTKIEGGPEARMRSEQSIPPLEVKLLPRAKPEWFFSYATDDEKKHNGPVADFCDKIKGENGVTVRRDVNELKYGDNIEKFMRQLAAGERIFVWLTDSYLKSPYCMFELHEIWRESCKRQQDNKAAEDFNQRVVVILEDAKIQLESEIESYRNFWLGEWSSISKEINMPHEIGEITVKRRNNICSFLNNTGEIIRYIQSRVCHQSFDTLKAAELG